MPDSQFQEEEMNVDEELAQSSPSPKSVNSLSLQDAQELVASLSAIALKLGNNDKGVIATLNQLLKQAEVLDKEQREQIVPLLGNLKALLQTSQDELKQFNAQAQKGLETQIKEVIGKVDFEPLNAKVKSVNDDVARSVGGINMSIQNLESTISARIAHIETTADRIKKMGFWASTKYLIAGMIVAISVGYGYSEIRTSNFEQNLQAQYDAKWNALESRFQLFKTQKSEQWNAVKMNDNGREYMQLVFRDGSKQVQCGWADTKQSGVGFAVSYINIPIYK